MSPGYLRREPLIRGRQVLSKSINNEGCPPEKIDFYVNTFDLGTCVGPKEISC